MTNNDLYLFSILFVKSFHDSPGSFRNVDTRAEDSHNSVFLQEVIVPDGNNTATENQDVQNVSFWFRSSFLWDTGMPVSRSSLSRSAGMDPLLSGYDMIALYPLIFM